MLLLALGGWTTANVEPCVRKPYKIGCPIGCYCGENGVVDELLYVGKELSGYFSTEHEF